MVRESRRRCICSRRWLELEGYKVFFTEWNSSAIVQEGNAKRKEAPASDSDDVLADPLHDFADRYERQIRAAAECRLYRSRRSLHFHGFRPRCRARLRSHWMRKLYSYALNPDVTFYFDVPLKTRCRRILDGRTRVKYHEAGMDMGYSKDPYESFRIFQGKINQEYRRMVREYDFIQHRRERTSRCSTNESARNSGKQNRPASISMARIAISPTHRINHAEPKTILRKRNCPAPTSNN